MYPSLKLPSILKFSREWLVAVLLLLPLLFINTRSSQNWGDDFSVYVQQAINISNGDNFDKSNFVYKENFTPIPPSAPAGFSLALVPVYRAFGFDMLAFNIFQSCLFIIWALLGFYFLRIYFSALASLVLIFIAFYSNFMLWLKLLLTSDILFSIFFLLAAILLNNLQNTTARKVVVIGAISTLAIFTRSVGWIIVPASWLYTAYLIVKSKSVYQRKFYIKHLLLLTGVIFAGYYIFNNCLFKSQFGFVQNATTLIDWKKLPLVFSANAIHYLNNYLSLFKSTDYSINAISQVFTYTMLAFTIIGIIVKFRKQAEASDFLFISYIVFIFSFPVIADYRYIVPVHIFIVAYLLTGLNWLVEKSQIKNLVPFQIVLGAMCLFIYTDHLKYLWKHGHETVSGPYEDISQETFAYIKKTVSANDLIVFNKPRALTLYTGKRSTLPNSEKSNEENYNTLHSMKAKYYLHSWSMKDKEYDSFIEQQKTILHPVYKNWQFVLYEDSTIRF